MNKLKIALLQITPHKELDENIKAGVEACKTAKNMGADIALFPEMFNNGYDIYSREPSQWLKDAVTEDSDYVTTFKELSSQLDMAICITMLLKDENGIYNTLVLFDRKGEKQFVYRKVHTCDFSAERALSRGEDFYVTELDTRLGSVKVGAMICFDREFPESARVLMLKGAELVLVPNACPMEINRLSQLRGRAYENMFAIATCNYPSTVPDCNGNSSVFDGVAYLPELPSSRDTCILQTGEQEDVFIAELDLDMLRRYRAKEVHGNAYRRPDKYGILLENEVKAPFVRNEHR